MSRLGTESDWRGKTASRTVVVTEEMLAIFTELSGDSSRVHVDEEAARERGFKGRVVHGFLLGALASSVVGLQLPGHDGLLQKASLSFHNPCYVDDEVTVSVSVTDYVESVRVLILAVTITNAEGTLLAKGEIRSGLAA